MWDLEGSTSRLLHTCPWGPGLGADLREATKSVSCHGDGRGHFSDFQGPFQRIKSLYLLYMCVSKTQMDFQWVLWHSSSLCQLNLESTRPNGACGFEGAKWPGEIQCQRIYVHVFLLSYVSYYMLYTKLSQIFLSQIQHGMSWAVC